MSCVRVWEKGMEGRGNSRCRSLELGVCFLCWRNIKKASVASQKEQSETEEFANKLIQKASRGVSRYLDI